MSAARAIQSATAYPPKGLRREAAAAYVGVSPSKFDEWVHDGRMPKPKRADAVVVWDRTALDLAFEALPSEGEINEWADALPAWRRSR